MDNKKVGLLIIGISIIIIFIIFLFDSALTSIVDVSCTDHGTSCPMYQTVNQQTYLALGIVGILVLFGLILIFSKPQEKVIVKTKTIKERKKQKTYDLSDFTKSEKEVFNIIKTNRTIFQAELIEKAGFGKVKMTRILDKLESRDIIERKRRGMTNIVVLKEN